MDYMNPDVHCPQKAGEPIHSLAPYNYYFLIAIEESCHSHIQPYLKCHWQDP